MNAKGESMVLKLGVWNKRKFRMDQMTQITLFTVIYGATKKLDRAYNESLYSKKFSRIKFGHPEGYLSAFSNLYREISHKIKEKKRYKNYLFPNEDDGLITAKYIDACVKSSKKKRWVKINA